MTSTSAIPNSVDELLEVMVEQNASDLHMTAGSHPRSASTAGSSGCSPTTSSLPRRFARSSIASSRPSSRRTSRRSEPRLRALDPRRGALQGQRVLPAREPGRSLPHDSRAHPVARRTEHADVAVRPRGNPRGLVLVTGPTGSGKSTTLASLLDHVNKTRHEHILTIEDPIEFLHWHQSCIVNQRELGPDATTFADALRAALREDPDVILVGEMRDLETIGRRSPRPRPATSCSRRCTRRARRRRSTV